MLNIFPSRRDLVIALGGRLVSTFGDEMALVALTLRLQADGAQPYEVAALLAAGVIPLMAVAGTVGRLVDSHDSRRLLIGAGLIEIACTVPLMIVHSVIAIVVLVAILGAVSSLTSATWSALIPRIVGEDQLTKAVSTRQTLNALVRMGAPAIAGLLTGAFGAGVPLALDAATFAIVTAAAAFVHTRRIPDTKQSTEQRASQRSGLEIIRTDHVLAPLTITLVGVVLLIGMVDVVLVFLVRSTLHGGAIWFGVAQAAWLAGMLPGALAAGRLDTEDHQTQATVTGAAIVCGALAAFAVAPAVWILVPLSIVGGIGNGLVSACFATLLVHRTPDAERGRVSATANAVLGGAQGASLLAGGAVAAVLSPRSIYAIVGLFGVAAAVAIAVFTRRPTDEADSVPAS